jgi:hypothetical protein
LFAKLFARVGSVWVRIEPVLRRRVGLARHKPRGPVVGVAVPLVVTGNNVEQDPVLLVWPQVGKAGSDSGKHPPERNEHIVELVDCDTLR